MDGDGIMLDRAGTRAGARYGPPVELESGMTVPRARRQLVLSVEQSLFLSV